ncbi:UPF0496 protein 4-like [Tripterygium wilfordii]|uniref:UPF0496 protein 4-like n=1 Tax=Tripterygium wilfordii TaxID=458696 RepID=A0A7J7CUK1_TRIWF|nr:UPF0496 protein 4-like [Tripterygium wilfordii]
MYLTEISNFPSSFSLFKKTKSKIGTDGGLNLISQSFDESSPSPQYSRSAVCQLVLALQSHDSTKVLDLCNFISSEIERLRHRRLSVDFAIHLLTTSDCGCNPETLHRTRASLSSLVNGVGSPEVNKRGFGIGSDDIKDLVKDLALRLESAPREKISSKRRLVHRTIYAVGLVTVFVAGVVVAAIHRSTELLSVRVPSEFSWAEAVNGLESAISTELTRRFGDKGERKAHFSEVYDV